MVKHYERVQEEQNRLTQFHQNLAQLKITYAEIESLKKESNPMDAIQKRLRKVEDEQFSVNGKIKNLPSQYERDDPQYWSNWEYQKEMRGLNAELGALSSKRDLLLKIQKNLEFQVYEMSMLSQSEEERKNTKLRLEKEYKQLSNDEAKIREEKVDWNNRWAYRISQGKSDRLQEIREKKELIREKIDILNKILGVEAGSQ